MDEGVEEQPLLLIVTSNPLRKSLLELNGNFSPFYRLLESSQEFNKKIIISLQIDINVA